MESRKRSLPDCSTASVCVPVRRRKVVDPLPLLVQQETKELAQLEEQYVTRGRTLHSERRKIEQSPKLPTVNSSYVSSCEPRCSKVNSCSLSSCRTRCSSVNSFSLSSCRTRSSCSCFSGCTRCADSGSCYSSSYTSWTIPIGTKHRPSDTCAPNTSILDQVSITVLAHQDDFIDPLGSSESELHPR